MKMKEMNTNRIARFTELRKVLDGLMEELGRENVGYVCSFTWKLPDGKRFGTLQHKGGDCQDLALEMMAALYNKQEEQPRGH